MKKDFYISLKQYFWNSLNRMSNSFSSLSVKNLGDGNIKCFWEISPIDNIRIELSKSCFYAIRLFDITNNRNKMNSTCIMKEIQVSKYQSSISFPIPLNKGVYYFEFGFRKKNGEWRKISHQNMNFGYRIKKVIQSFENENWFDFENRRINNDIGNQEKAYQFLLNKKIGGSENFSYKK